MFRRIMSTIAAGSSLACATRGLLFMIADAASVICKPRKRPRRTSPSVTVPSSRPLPSTTSATFASARSIVSMTCLMLAVGATSVSWTFDMVRSQRPGISRLFAGRSRYTTAPAATRLSSPIEMP